MSIFNLFVTHDWISLRAGKFVMSVCVHCESVFVGQDWEYLEVEVDLISADGGSRCLADSLLFSCVLDYSLSSFCPASNNERKINVTLSIYCQTVISEIQQSKDVCSTEYAM